MAGVGVDARAFARESARYLVDVYLPRLERAARALPVDDLWWRPHAGALSFATVLVHLEGNVRQWLLSGLGGRPDDRDRAAEFAAADGAAFDGAAFDGAAFDGAAFDGAGVDELLERLGGTVRAAAELVAGLDEDALARRHRIQGGEVAGWEAVYHVVEHFSWHVGQAVWIAKARGGADHGVSFFDDDRINAARNA